MVAVVVVEVGVVVLVAVVKVVGNVAAIVLVFVR